MALPLSNDAVDLLLGTDNDLVVTDDLQFVSGIAGVAQMCRIAVQMFAGEWFLDLDVGVPYWDAILGQSPDVAMLAARSGFRDELLKVDGVVALLFLNVDFSDAKTRTLTVSWQVRTSLGDTPVDSLTLGGV